MSCYSSGSATVVDRMLESTIFCNLDLDPMTLIYKTLVVVDTFRRALKTHLFDHRQLQRRVTVFFSRAVYKSTCLLTYLLTNLTRRFLKMFPHAKHELSKSRLSKVTSLQPERLPHVYHNRCIHRW